MTKREALREIAWIVDYMTVTDETLDAPDSVPCDWTWDEQHDIAMRLKAALEALTIKGAL